MTLVEFAPVCQTLAAQFRADMDATAIKAYHAALSDMPTEAVKAAAETLARDAERRFMPTAPEWRGVALQARSERIAKTFAPVPEREPWRHECLRCEDTGFEQFDADGRALICPGGDQRICGKRCTSPHSVCWVCACRATNRTYQRKQFASKGHAA